MKHVIVLLLCTLFFTHSAAANTNEEFPARKLYPAVPYIELDDFHAKRHKVIVVDVRSAYEFETLRIKGAINIPLASPDYVQRMQQLREDNPDTQIVTYCNGKTCKKSYKAVQKCRNHNIPNVVAYDAGIMDWARAYPGEALLLGKTLGDPQKLISKTRLKSHMVKPQDFEAALVRTDIIVLDVRDRFQREGLALFPGIDRRAALDKKEEIKKYVEQAKRENKTLMVYDAAGKQVRWLMYYLEEEGLKNYKFMSGGANAYYAALREKYVQ